jgi:PKD repeat protein
MKKILMLQVMLAAMVVSLFVTSCKDDEETPPSGVVASFQFVQDADDFHKVKFTNFSQNYASLSWNFGDGTAATSEENPTHSFATAGTYNVKLTATGSDGVTSEKALDVVISDPNIELRKLTGDVSKSWKLVRQVENNYYPIEVGPSAGGNPYYQLGGALEEIGNRPCSLDDEFIFSLDGIFTYNSHGNFWAEIGGSDGPWNSSIGAAGCYDSDVAENWKNVNNEDITAWGDGEHEFSYDVANKKLTVEGLGAWVGLPKVGTTENVVKPQSSVAYEVVKLVDAAVDTLVLKVSQTNGNYWKFVLVHYDDGAQEPAIPSSKPSASFTYEINGNDVTFTNTTTSADSYVWDFGDDATSTSTSPVHTYSGDGTYSVKLTATNASGESSVTQNVIIGGAECTADATESLTPSGAGIKLTLETDSPNGVFGGFAGVVGGRVANPYVKEGNLSCNVNQYHKVTSGCLDYAGAAVGLSTAINFASDKKKFSIKVYAVNKVTDVVLRIERLAYPDVDPAYEKTATITATGEWQTLTFDFSDTPDAPTFKNLVIYFDRGACGEESFYYFDDLQQID